VTAALDAGEERPGQEQMADAIELAIARGTHLAVQAGTGTGKSLAYLVPAVLSGKRTIVATATKALQDQLVGKDLPFLQQHLGVPFTFSALKGRSNYLCVQRAHEVLAADADQLALEGLADRGVHDDVVDLVAWGNAQLSEGASGDRATLDREPSERAWAAVSVSAAECPGATRCAVSAACFCEAARQAAAAADVVVVNTHLYGMHLASGGVVLPDHDVVVIDEAHGLEDVISSTAGLELSAARFTAVARAVRAVVADPALPLELEAAGRRLGEALAVEEGRRLRRIDGELGEALTLGRERLTRAASALRTVPRHAGDAVEARRLRATKLVTTLVDHLDVVAAQPEGTVAWVEGTARQARLRVAPIDVADALRPLWQTGTVVLTSATVPASLPARLGAEATLEVLDVGSPFDYATNAMLYCAAHLPDPRKPGYEAAMHDELEALMMAAGGRTLALFTSYRAMTAAAGALRTRVPFPVLVQGDRPKPALLAEFASDEATCLFATMGFWQGVDLLGPTLSLVTIDRLPFPRPDEPLLQARRERARQAAFAVVDLPRAATLLAQGAGRLIRSAADRGVVAVLDPRLATARYRWQVVNALPPMRRSRDRDDVTAFLRSITGQTALSR
jgi:ATP-dependent DNA helicase DinG